MGAASRAVLAGGAETSPRRVHVWEKQEIVLTSQHIFPNPYTDVTVWVELAGPGFNKRVYGFWNGGNEFCVRIVATAPGTWCWRSGSEPPDPGLSGKSGTFEATGWTEDEKQENPLRRGFLCSTPNNHALQTADGTPFFAVGDTWYATGTNRFRWYDDDQERPIGPERRASKITFASAKRRATTGST